MKAEGRMTNGEWKTVALEEVATIERSAIQPDAIGQGTAYLGLEHIESGGRILGAKPVDEGELASSKFKFTERHVLYGKLRPYLAKIACPEFTGICSTDILPILPGPDLERRFLCYFLRQPSMVDYANSRASGANLPRLSPSALAQFEIPLPPLAEQRRIAEVLDRAEALRAKRRAALAQLDSLTQSLFLDMFGDPATNPKGLEVRSLGELAENKDSVRVPVKQSDRDQRSGQYPYYGSVGIIDAIDDYLFEGQHLLISEDGKHLESRNSPVACLADGRFWVNNHAHVLAFNGQAELIYLAYTLELRSLRQYVTGIDQFKLNRKTMDIIPVPLPPIELQREFARRVTAVETLKTAHRASLADLDALFATLQHRAFRGEL